MLNGARSQARQTFESNRTMSDNGSISESIEHAEQVAKILRQNVVQGQESDDEGHFSMSTKAVWNYDTSLIHCAELNIHEATERGDNETIKAAGQVLKQTPAEQHS